METGKFISVYRVAGTLYWDCPKKGCYHPHTLLEVEQLPRTYHCKCGCIFIVNKITQTTQSAARLWIEVKL
jgi:hypothetical protein